MESNTLQYKEHGFWTQLDQMLALTKLLCDLEEFLYHQMGIICTLQGYFEDKKTNSAKFTHSRCSVKWWLQ